MEGVGVGLGQHPAIPGLNGVLVGIVLLQAGDEALPHASAHAVQQIAHLVPAVEISHDAHRLGMGRPHTEAVTLLTIHLVRMRAQILLGPDGLSVEERLQGSRFRRHNWRFRHRYPLLVGRNSPKTNGFPQESLVIGNKIAPNTF